MLISVEAEDQISLDVMDEIKSLLESYDAYISSEVGNDAAGNLASEMQVILAIVFTIIVLVLQLARYRLRSPDIFQNCGGGIYGLFHRVDRIR